MAPGRNKHHAVKPHLARQARQEAAAAESAAQLESFVVEAREATILPLQSQEDIEYVQSLARREGDRGGHLIRWAGGGGGGGDGDGDGDGQAEDVSEVWLDRCAICNTSRLVTTIKRILPCSLLGRCEYCNIILLVSFCPSC